MHHREKDRKHAFLTLLEQEPRITPPCSHVHEGCGGCLLQEYAYTAQVHAKAAYLHKLYDKEIPVHPCSQPLGYRGRMDFVTAFDKIGLRKRARFAQVVDIKECLLLPRQIQPMFEKIRETLHTNNIQDYNYIRHEGFLRYITVRTSVATHETLIIFTTTSPKTIQEEEQFKKICENIASTTTGTGVHWTINDEKADVSIGKAFWHTGSTYITEEICTKKFRITPWTFFQANTTHIGNLFAKAMQYAKGNVLDLYCGTGVLSILAATQPEVTGVIGIDIITQSIQAAQENNILNNTTVSFITADVENYLHTCETTYDTVICDPARPGLGKNVCSTLLTMLPKQIIYISCNPLSHKDDLALLQQKYDITLLEAYDVFPQTPHIEILSVLTLRNN